MLVAEINHVRDSSSHKEHANLTLIAKNQLGYKNLIKLISKSQILGKTSGVPVIESAWLSEHAEGLIALSGGFRGHIGKAILDNNHDLFLKGLSIFKNYLKKISSWKYPESIGLKKIYTMNTYFPTQENLDCQ